MRRIRRWGSIHRPQRARQLSGVLICSWGGTRALTWSCRGLCCKHETRSLVSASSECRQVRLPVSRRAAAAADSSPIANEAGCQSEPKPSRCQQQSPAKTGIWRERWSHRRTRCRVIKLSHPEISERVHRFLLIIHIRATGRGNSQHDLADYSLLGKLEEPSITDCFHVLKVTER